MADKEPRQPTHRAYSAGSPDGSFLLLPWRQTSIFHRERQAARSGSAPSVDLSLSFVSARQPYARTRR